MARLQGRQSTNIRDVRKREDFEAWVARMFGPAAATFVADHLTNAPDEGQYAEMAEKLGLATINDVTNEQIAAQMAANPAAAFGRGVASAPLPVGAFNPYHPTTPAIAEYPSIPPEFPVLDQLPIAMGLPPELAGLPAMAPLPASTTTRPVTQFQGAPDPIGSYIEEDGSVSPARVLGIANLGGMASADPAPTPNDFAASAGFTVDPAGPSITGTLGLSRPEYETDRAPTRMSAAGREHLKQFESTRRNAQGLHVAYDDGFGYMTIGYGHAHTLNGEPIRPGMTLTDAEAEALFEQDVQKYENKVLGKLGEAVGNLTQPQFDALVSLTHNYGTLHNDIANLVKAGRVDEVPAELATKNTVRGKPVRGLTNRRNLEIAMWNENPAAPVMDDKAQVAQIQADLGILGFQDEQGRPLAVDGIVGPATISAIREMQAQAGLSVTGSLDQVTTAAIQQRAVSPNSPTAVPATELAAQIAAERVAGFDPNAVGIAPATSPFDVAQAVAAPEPTISAPALVADEQQAMNAGAIIGDVFGAPSAPPAPTPMGGYTPPAPPADVLADRMGAVSPADPAQVAQMELAARMAAAPQVDPALAAAAAVAAAAQRPDLSINTDQQLGPLNPLGSGVPPGLQAQPAAPVPNLAVNTDQQLGALNPLGNAVPPDLVPQEMAPALTMQTDRPAPFTTQFTDEFGHAPLPATAGTLTTPPVDLSAQALPAPEPMSIAGTVGPLNPTQALVSGTMGQPAVAASPDPFTEVAGRLPASPTITGRPDAPLGALAAPAPVPMGGYTPTSLGTSVPPEAFNDRFAPAAPLPSMAPAPSMQAPYEVNGPPPLTQVRPDPFTEVGLPAPELAGTLTQPLQMTAAPAPDAFSAVTAGPLSTAAPLGPLAAVGSPDLTMSGTVSAPLPSMITGRPEAPLGGFPTAPMAPTIVGRPEIPAPQAMPAPNPLDIMTGPERMGALLPATTTQGFNAPPVSYEQGITPYMNAPAPTMTSYAPTVPVQDLIAAPAPTPAPAPSAGFNAPLDLSGGIPQVMSPGPVSAPAFTSPPTTSAAPAPAATTPTGLTPNNVAPAFGGIATAAPAGIGPKPNIGLGAPLGTQDVLRAGVGFLSGGPLGAAVGALGPRVAGSIGNRFGNQRQSPQGSLFNAFNGGRQGTNYNGNGFGGGGYGGSTGGMGGNYAGGGGGYERGFGVAGGGGSWADRANYGR